jgi:hypothetical protein
MQSACQIKAASVWIFTLSLHTSLQFQSNVSKAPLRQFAFWQIISSKAFWSRMLTVKNCHRQLKGHYPGPLSAIPSANPQLLTGKLHEIAVPQSCSHRTIPQPLFPLHVALGATMQGIPTNVVPALLSTWLSTFDDWLVFLEVEWLLYESTVVEGTRKEDPENYPTEELIRNKTPAVTRLTPKSYGLQRAVLFRYKLKKLKKSSQT